jgi:hypothetical protein
MMSVNAVVHRNRDVGRLNCSGPATPTANLFGGFSGLEPVGFSGLEPLSGWSKLRGMTVNETALDFVCPVCNAKPREECVRLDGHTMCEPHKARKNLILGVKPRNRREDINRIAERVGRVV